VVGAAQAAEFFDGEAQQAGVAVGVAGARAGDDKTSIC
jgi:hypothetical protein